jgi:hypothetical protein
MHVNHGLPVYLDSRARAGRGVCVIATNYRHHHHMDKGLIALSQYSARCVGWHGARLTKCTSPDPRSGFKCTSPDPRERHRLLLGAASDGVYPFLLK